MLNQNSFISRSRYERKYFLENFDVPKIHNIILLHPQLFSSIYYPRQVNNIYFDNNNFDNYKNNLEGVPERFKIRIRWYGNQNNANNPQLEFKVKKGLLGKKKNFSLNNFTFENYVPKFSDLVKKGVSNSFLKKVSSELYSPVLFNSYQRQYYQSQDKHFRLTLDSNLNFYQIRNNKIKWHSKFKISGLILELKYDQEFDNQAQKIASFFPFRITRSSKYILGMRKFYSYLPL